MKTTSYKCDRCGAALGEDGEALEINRFCSHDRIIRRIKFISTEKVIPLNPIVYELCEPCRESLERWLNNENA